jgi:hypothetical protein
MKSGRSFTARKRTSPAKAAPPQAGDGWTWVAICADTKLVPSWLVGSRDADAAQYFMGDLALRLNSRIQPTSDGHKPYLRAVEEAFGADIDYAMLVKQYGAPEGALGRHAAASASVQRRSGALRIAPTPTTSRPAMPSGRTSR